MTDSGSNLRFQFDHTYDSAGNRTALAISGNLYNARSFGYTFNAWGNVTQVTENVNLNNYVAAVTSDANGNITEIEETWNGQDALTNTFEYDFENRLIEHDCASVGTTVEHKYDGLGRLLRTDRTVAGPTTTTFEHVRDGLKVVGNIDATNTNIAPTWTNKPGSGVGAAGSSPLRPIESQQLQTNASQQFINVSDEITPARRTYNPSSSAAGDTSAIASKGRLVLVNGSLPAEQGQTTTYPSELFSHRNMTYNENSIALSSDRGTLELSGVNLMYEGTRVKSWLVGRDLNPAGRGDGSHYALGDFSIGSIRPVPTTTPVGGWGNSVNNQCGGACPPGDGILPDEPPNGGGFIPGQPPDDDGDNGFCWPPDIDYPPPGYPGGAGGYERIGGGGAEDDGGDLGPLYLGIPCGEDCREIFDKQKEATKKLGEKIDAANRYLANCWLGFFAMIFAAVVIYAVSFLACMEWFVAYPGLTHWWLFCCVLAALITLLAILCSAWGFITNCINNYRDMIYDALIEFINEDYKICLELKNCMSDEPGCPEIHCAGPEWIEMPEAHGPPTGACELMHALAWTLRVVCGAKWSRIHRVYEGRE